MKKCYYKILGVSVRASQEEIKKAFRALALRWHPDRNQRADPDAPERFREALTAYETLVDPTARRQYDNSRGYRRSGKKSSRDAYEDGGGRGSTVREVFEEAFGIDLGSIRARRRNDLRFDLQVSRGTVREGCYEVISYPRMMFCRVCMGNGRRKPSPSCKSCFGNGEIEEECSVKVWIPAGSEDGARLRILGAGDCLGPGEAPGDLVVLLRVVDRG